MCWLPDVRFPWQHLWPLYQMCFFQGAPVPASAQCGKDERQRCQGLPATGLSSPWCRVDNIDGDCDVEGCDADQLLEYSDTQYEFSNFMLISARSLSRPSWRGWDSWLTWSRTGWEIFLLLASFQQFVTDIQNIYENNSSIPCDLENDLKTLIYFRCLLSQTLPSTSGPPWLVCPVIMAQYSVVNIVGRMHTPPPRTDKPLSHALFL